MKKLIPALVALAVVIGNASCKKCSTCTFSEDGLDEKFVFAEGDLITVTSNSILTYKEATHVQGDTFTISYDANAFGNGLQFQGTGTVKRTITDEFCDKGRSYNDQLDQHKKNGWACADGEKKDASE